MNLGLSMWSVHVLPMSLNVSVIACLFLYVSPVFNWWPEPYQPTCPHEIIHVR